MEQAQLKETLAIAHLVSFQWKSSILIGLNFTDEAVRHATEQWITVIQATWMNVIVLCLWVQLY